MNIKINFIVFLLGTLLGAYLYSNYSSKTKQEIKIVEVEKKSGIVKRHINKKSDGSEQIDEVELYLIEHKNETIQKSENKNNTGGIIYKYDFKSNKHGPAAFYTYKNIGIYGSESEIGLALTLSW